MERDDINKLAAWMMANGYATGHGETMEDLLAELKWQIDEKIALECARREREILDMCKEGLWDGEGIKFHLAKRGAP